MKSLIQKSRLAELMEQRNGYLVLASGLLMLCIFLVILSFYLSGRERVIVVPPIVERAFWVSNNEVSPEYLSEMTAFFAYLRLNVTPDSIDHQRQTLLHYTDPRYYGVLNDALVAERDQLFNQHITTAFYPVDVKVDAKALTAQITGDLLSSVGNTHMNPQRVSYQIHYRYDNGRLLVSNFQEVKIHD